MTDTASFRIGRLPFEPRGIDNDYSGLSISDRYLENANVEKSFFNGVNLINCAFVAVRLNNSEFSEAKAERCEFDETDLSGADFVDCLFDKVLFSKCNFEKGEWREATFRNCKFLDCNFGHTTVALCKFVNCEFDAASLSSAEHRAIYFNVFTICKFARPIADVVFASRNFGTPAAGAHTGLVHPASGVNIEQICLLNNLGQLRIAALADVAESICTTLGGKAQRRNSTLTFFSKIIRVLTDERRISATSLIYLEELITRFATTVDDQDLFMAAMAAVIEIRSALFTVASEPQAAEDTSVSRVRSITIYFSTTYARHQAEILRDALAEAAGIPPKGLRIETFRSGSTLIEIASTTILSTGALLTGLNFVLRQATVTVRRVAALKRAIDRIREEARRNAQKRQLVRQLPRKVRSILKSGAVAPELIPVRAAVRRSGRTLVELDENAEVTILSEHPDRR